MDDQKIDINDGIDIIVEFDKFGSSSSTYLTEKFYQKFDNVFSSFEGVFSNNIIVQYVSNLGNKFTKTFESKERIKSFQYEKQLSFWPADGLVLDPYEHVKASMFFQKETVDKKLRKYYHCLVFNVFFGWNEDQTYDKNRFIDKMILHSEKCKANVLTTLDRIDNQHSNDIINSKMDELLDSINQVQHEIRLINNNNNSLTK